MVSLNVDFWYKVSDNVTAKDHQAGQMTEGHYDSTIYSLHSTSSMPSRREPIPVDAENEPYPTSRELPQDPAEQGGRAKQEGNVAAAYVRNVMNRLAQAQSDKEDFAQQLAYYKERLQQAEERNQTLSGSIGFMNQRLTQLEGEWQRERGVVEDLQPYRDAARERMEERMAACVEFILEKVPEGTEIPMELLEMLPPARVDAIIRANEGANLV